MLKAIKNYQSKQAVGCFPSGTLKKKELVNGTMGGKQSLNYPSWRFLHEAAALWKCRAPMRFNQRFVHLLCLCLSFSATNEAIKFISTVAQSRLLTMSRSFQLLPVSAYSLRSGFLTNHSLDCRHFPLPPARPTPGPSKLRNSPIVNHLQGYLAEQAL